MGTLAEGIKEIFATAKTTGSNVMLCGNDGTPDGHMTLANLASVLGVVNIKGSYNDSDIDQKVDIGYYTGWSDTYGILILFVYQNTNGNPIQIEFSKNVIRYRYYANSWASWATAPFDIPSFYKNYSSINSLIDAVNPFRTINMLGETDSWDNLQNGVYCFSNAHAGADVAFGFMIQYGYQSDRVLQFAVGIMGIAKRYNIGNGWEEWSYSRF